MGVEHDDKALLQRLSSPSHLPLISLSSPSACAHLPPEWPKPNPTPRIVGSL